MTCRAASHSRLSVRAGTRHILNSSWHAGALHISCSAMFLEICRKISKYAQWLNECLIVWRISCKADRHFQGHGGQQIAWRISGKAVGQVQGNSGQQKAGSIGWEAAWISEGTLEDTLFDTSVVKSLDIAHQWFSQQCSVHHT